MLKIHLHSGLDYGIEQHVAELVTLYIKQLLFLQMRQHECGHQQRVHKTFIKSKATAEENIVM